MASDPAEPATTVDSLLRAVARTPRVAAAGVAPGLAPGMVLADNFELLAELGRGGMGVVYRALDRRLGREVAIKVMRADRWAHLPRAKVTELLEREARATARLRHPAIVTLHQVGEHDGALYLVLELLRGESLAVRLRRPMALAAAIATMRTIADALVHAHGEGVLHRDLKPHNVFIGDDGQVWVLDFGLASLQAAAGPDEQTAAMSRAGTPAYMAPEQRGGTAQDERTDVWALGLLLYQLVTAYEPPPLTTAADLTSPPWRTDLARLPPTVAAVIGKATSWRPDDRHASAAAFRADLDTVPPDELAAAPPPRAARGRRGPLIAAVIVAAVAVGALLVIVSRRDRAPPRPAATAPPRSVRFALPLAPTEPFATFQAPMAAVSPDGRTIVYLGRPADGGAGASQLYLRRLDDDTATPLPDSVDAEGPFFSPDGTELAYAKAGELWRRPLAGGPPVLVCAVRPGFRGGTWTRDGMIVMSPTWFSGLYAVPATGGTPRPLTTLGPDEKSHRFPHVLPDGQAVLFVASDARSESFDDTSIEAVELATGRRHLVTTGGAPKFLPPATLLVPRAGTLVALPFDPRTLTVTGPPATVLDGLVTAPNNGVAAFDVSAAGTLVYVVGGPELFTTQVVRVDGRGAATPLDLPDRAATSVRLGVDGKLLVRADAANATLWLHDLVRETDTRVTWSWDADHAVLAPDGDHLYLVVTRGAQAEIVRHRTDGVGAYEPLYVGLNPANLELSRDGQRLFFDDRDPTDGNGDILVLSLDQPGPPTRIIDAPTHDTQPAISPDGRWLAYTSSGSGRDEIYVQAYPEAGPRVQISAHGGRWARWSADGRTLLYRNGPAVMTVPITAGPRLVAGKPALRFELADVDDPGRRTFDLAPDGTLVSVKRATTWRPADTLRVVLDWQPTPLPRR